MVKCIALLNEQMQPGKKLQEMVNLLQTLQMNTKWQVDTLSKQSNMFTVLHLVLVGLYYYYYCYNCMLSDVYTYIWNTLLYNIHCIITITTE